MSENNKVNENKPDIDFLIETLRKTQSLVQSSQRSWSKERVDLKSQYSSLEKSSKRQLNSLKNENKLLREELSTSTSGKETESTVRNRLLRKLTESSRSVSTVSRP